MGEKTSNGKAWHGVALVLAVVAAFGAWIAWTAVKPLSGASSPVASSPAPADGAAIVRERSPAFDSEEALEAAHRAGRAGDRLELARIVSTRGTHLEAGERATIIGYGSGGHRRVQTTSGTWWVDVDNLEGAR